MAMASPLTRAGNKKHITPFSKKLTGYVIQGLGTIQSAVYNLDTTPIQLES